MIGNVNSPGLSGVLAKKVDDATIHLITGGKDYKGEYSSDKSYLAGNVILYETEDGWRFLEAKSDIVAGSTFDPSQWQAASNISDSSSIAIPVQNGSITYDGTAKTPVWNNYASSKMTITGETSATAAGPHQVTFHLVNSEDAWEDGTTTDKTVTWTINRLPISVPTQAGSITYDGTFKEPTWNNYNSSVMTIGGDTSGTDADTYTATFTPDANHCWDTDGTYTAKEVEWAIGKKPIPLPAQSGTLVYNTNEQSPTWDANYVSSIMTLGGTTAGTNAGSYPATFTITSSNHKWEDSDDATQPVNWSIGKAAGSASASPSTVDLNASSLTGTVTITRSGTGVVGVQSTSDSDVATATASGTTVTITGKTKSGTATITVAVAESANYLATTTTITVNLTLFSPETATPEDIVNAINSGDAASLMDAGDSFNITTRAATIGTLSIPSGSYKLTVLGVNHNASVEGNNRVHFILGKNSSGVDIAFCESEYNSYAGKFRHHTSNTNAGGWKSSDLRTFIQNFKSILPAAIADAIKTTTKWTANAGNVDTADAMESVSDQIFLLSEYEIFGTRSYANQYEKDHCKQYDYYKNGNSKVRYRHDAPSTAVLWWERSPYYDYTTYFCHVSTGGSAGITSADNSSGLAPAFSL